MNEKEENRLIQLISREPSWKVLKVKRPRRGASQYEVITPDLPDKAYPLVHPYRIHLSLYRILDDADSKYQHMKAAHDYLWPLYKLTWNEWDEIRFRAHCAGYAHIVLAGGAGVAKSDCCARIACLWYLAAPRKRAVIVSSTTMDSLESRIWGYIQEFLNSSALPLPVKVYEGKPPKVLPLKRSGKMYGMFAVAVKQGEDAKVISTIIGRHPKGGIMFILDESPDMDPAVTNAVTNLRKGTVFFQLWALGNSKSKNDLHGALATPKAGWDSVHPLKNDSWPTSHENGICIYFNPYKSPAITETDPIKRLALSKFLPTEESLLKDVELYGDKSENFWRMTLGFWKSQDMDKTATSEKFLEERQVGIFAEWSGYYPLELVGGFDAAYRFGGTGAVLRLGYYGHTTSNLMTLDFRREELIYRMDVSRGTNVSPELQIARQIIAILARHKMPLHRLAFDITGSGKAMAELVRQVMQTQHQPIKIWFTGLSKRIQPHKDDPSILTGRPDHFWTKLKEFATEGQIKGLDDAAAKQFATRLIIEDSKRPGFTRLETKEEYRNRMRAVNPALAHSPDEADAAVLCLFAAIQNFGFRTGLRRDPPIREDSASWQHKIFQYDVNRQKEIERLRGDVMATSQRRRAVVPNFRSGVESLVKRRG